MNREDFIKKMNEFAISIGATRSSFIEPTGLSPENVSTTHDYALITKEALKETIITKACISKEYSFATINTKILHNIKNTSSLVRNASFNITGSKTGYLEEAGYCLMTRVKSKSGANATVIVFGAESMAKRNTETTNLINYALARIDGSE